jgi:integrase/recombinase XerD
MNKQVILKPLYHRGQESIALVYDNYSSLNAIVKKLPQVKWSQTNKCWYMPLSREHYNNIVLALQDKAIIENSALHQYLAEKKKNTENKEFNIVPTSSKVKSARATVSVAKPVVYQKTNIPTRDYRPADIHPVNAHILPEMEQRLILMGYSASTQKTYLNEVGVFLRTIKQHPAETFSKQRIKDYLQFCYDKLGLTENTLHSRMNALKFYYEKVLKREKFFWDIPRPKKGFLLPKVLSKEEMIRLIKAIENVKHKTMIMLGYACGLRVSEITGLEVKDIDEDRRLLFVRRGKGKKDRVVSLSPVMLVMIREYKAAYKPGKYLFEGQHKESQYSIRSLESIIKAAKKKAGISKTGSMHMLRHSFATHLIDKGTDVVFIQKLLGHNNIKTTLRYLHVTNKDMLNILSPLEDIKDFL